MSCLNFVSQKAGSYKVIKGGKHVLGTIKKRGAFVPATPFSPIELSDLAGIAAFIKGHIKCSSK